MTDTESKPSNLVFPLVGTKVEGLNQKFDLTDPVSRQQYFEAKVGKEIEKIKSNLKVISGNMRKEVEDEIKNVKY